MSINGPDGDGDGGDLEADAATLLWALGPGIAQTEGAAMPFGAAPAADMGDDGDLSEAEDAALSFAPRDQELAPIAEMGYSAGPADRRKKGGAQSEAVPLLSGPERRRQGARRGRFRKRKSSYLISAAEYQRPQTAWEWIVTWVLPRGKLSMFRGAYVPACIGLVGPTLFLRTSFVLAEGGFVMTVLIVLAIGLIGMLTVSGVSAIVTNGKMQPGGPYFLISRTLGVELGGAIGVLLLMEHVVGAAYYLSILSELLSLSSTTLTGPIDYSYNYQNGIRLGSVSLLLALCFALSGMRFYSTIAVTFFFVKLAALVVAMGSILFAKPANHHPTPENNVTVHDYYSGPDLRSFMSNVYPHEDEGERLKGTHFENFLRLFSIVFAAFAGITVGANFTGSVRAPGSSIPRGLAWATMTGVFFFLAMAAVITSCVWKLYLLPEGAREVVLRLCISEYWILAGMFACCVGTTVVHLIGAGTVIRFMALDGMVPRLEPIARRLEGSGFFLGRNWHNLVAWALMQASLFIGSPSAVAPFLSLTYLFFTSVINGALLLLMLIGAPSFRPRFKYFSKSTAAIGFVAPLVIMIGIDHVLTLVFVGVFLLLVIIYSVAAPPKEFGEVTQAIIFHQVRKYLLHLSRKKMSTNRFWRPSLLLFETENPEFMQRRELNLLEVANFMKKGGLFLVASIIQEEFHAGALEQREAMLKMWVELFERLQVKALPIVGVASDARHGLQQAMFMSGIGSMKPNTVMLKWFGPATQLGPMEYVNTIRDVQSTDMHLLLCRNFEQLDFEEIRAYQQWMRGQGRLSTESTGESHMTVDVWSLPLTPSSLAREAGLLWEFYEESVAMCLQLATTLRMNKVWAKLTRMRVLVLVESEADAELEKERWTIYLRHVRMEAIIKPIVIGAELRELGLSLNGASDRFVEVFDEEEGQLPSPIAMPLLAAHSPFYTQLDVERRMQLCHVLLRRYSGSSSLMFLPLPPPCADKTADCAYLTELTALTDHCAPTFLVHAKTNVIFTDL